MALKEQHVLIVILNMVFPPCLFLRVGGGPPERPAIPRSLTKDAQGSLLPMSQGHVT